MIITNDIKFYGFQLFQDKTMHGFIFHRVTILHTIIVTILLFQNLQTLKANADGFISDSISKDTSSMIIHDPNPKGNHFVRSRWIQSTHIGVPLIISGLIVKRQDDQFRSLRNDFMPHFHHTLDNYSQYTSAVVMLGLKAAGIESRSSWGRMFLSDAFSAIIMGTTVNTLKATTHVMRPDGSNRHSFPSGHTATAFMTATMLSKEYGYLSPWVSIGAYGVATATGLTRMANNKHWLSDVMVGAGIGILSSEFGYWIADEICKDRGLKRKPQTKIFQNDNASSFLGVYMGINLPLSKYDLNKACRLKLPLVPH
jgi:membrane-associated phospholipid phosphatase